MSPLGAAQGAPEVPGARARRAGDAAAAATAAAAAAARLPGRILGRAGLRAGSVVLGIHRHRLGVTAVVGTSRSEARRGRERKIRAPSRVVRIPGWDYHLSEYHGQARRQCGLQDPLPQLLKGRQDPTEPSQAAAFRHRRRPAAPTNPCCPCHHQPAPAGAHSRARYRRGTHASAPAGRSPWLTW